MNKKFEKKDIAIALIGLGPHAKRIYLHYFQKHNINLALVVDIESEKDKVNNYLKENGFSNTNTFIIPNSNKDYYHLNLDVENKLLNVCKQLKITHIIISSEPKAHNMYLEFALKNNIHVMVDKPITVTKNMTSKKSINLIRNQYYNILNLASNSSAICRVMCQRQYHRGYVYIKKLLEETVKKYQVPITYIDIYHCDGNWEMPHDLDKENHPYKYGYGKLFHSGYHFIDLLSDFIKINENLEGSKKITKGEVYSNIFTPNDELNIFNVEDYRRIFADQNIPDYYQKPINNFYNYGEKNFYGIFKFTNSCNQTITNANLNLLHYGFSRRGWIESKEYYKKNGRIRHERINIQVGTLLNIQVHSYQSKEIKDRNKNYLIEEKTGGLEHFDIDIYRNVDIIGGKPYERIKLGDLYTEEEKKNILGYNELSREICLTEFLKGSSIKGDIKDQELAIELLYSCALGVHNYYKNIKKVEKINIRNVSNAICINDLKIYSDKTNFEEEKNLLDIYENIGDNFSYRIITNYLINKNKYEVYLCIFDNDNIASCLLLKEFTKKINASLYTEYLKYLVTHKNINNIVKMLKNSLK